MLDRLGMRGVAGDVMLMEACGCQECGGSGFRGRSVIYEIMPITHELQDLIQEGASERKVEEAARRSGMQTLLETGIAKSIAGETTLEEVLQVTSRYSA